MPRIYVFDVNETLLDLRALDPLFAETFGDAAARREWFSQMLQLAFVSTITGEYRDFGMLGAAALDMLASRRGVSLKRERRTALLGGLPAVAATSRGSGEPETLCAKPDCTWSV